MTPRHGDLSLIMGIIVVLMSSNIIFFCFFTSLPRSSCRYDSLPVSPCPVLSYAFETLQGELTALQAHTESLRRENGVLSARLSRVQEALESASSAATLLSDVESKLRTAESSLVSCQARSSSLPIGASQLSPLEDAEPSVIQAASNHVVQDISVAIVLPFIACQIDRVAEAVALWAARAPCDPAKPPTRVRFGLFFHFNRKLNNVNVSSDSARLLVDRIAAVWHALGPLQQCFQRGYTVLSADLTPAEDRYPDGPCVMFYRTFFTLRAAPHHYHYWLQLEPDVRPIRPGWAYELARLVVSNGGGRCASWWQLGSTPQYPSPVDSDSPFGIPDLHFNGNALYCVNNVQYDAFRFAVQEAFPPAGCSGLLPFTDGFDHASYLFRTHPTFRGRVATSTGKFHEWQFIVNFGESPYHEGTVLAHYRDAYFVHSKYPLVSSYRQRLLFTKWGTAYVSPLIHATFFEILGRRAHDSELSLFLNAIRSQRMDVSGIRCLLLWLIKEQLMTFESLLDQCGRHLLIKSAAVDLFLTPSVAKHIGSSILMAQHVPMIPENLVRGDMEHLSRRSLEEQYCHTVPVTTPGVLSSLLPHNGLKKKQTMVAFTDFPSRACPIALQTLVNPSPPPNCFSAHYVGNGFVDYHCLSSASQLVVSSVNMSACVALGPDRFDGKIRCTGEGDATPSIIGRLPYFRLHYLRHLKGLFPQSRFAEEFMRYYSSINVTFKSFGNSIVPHPTVSSATWLTYTPDWYLYSADFHAGPLICNIDIFNSLGGGVYTTYEPGTHCDHFEHRGKSLCNSRKTALPLGLQRDGYSLYPCPGLSKTKTFYDLQKDLEVVSSHVVFLSHPVANVEVYMAMNKSLIVYSTQRLEFGRHDNYIDWRRPTYMSATAKVRWLALVDNIRKLSKDPRSAVLANGKYDAQYTEYFTGVKTRVIPMWCGPAPKQAELQPHLDSLVVESRMSSDYHLPNRSEILIAPYRTNLEFLPSVMPDGAEWPSMSFRRNTSAMQHPILRSLKAAVAACDCNLSFVTQKQLYGTDTDVAATSRHPAVLFLPYQVSTVQFCQMYRMNVPILVPSLDLLVSWTIKYKIMWERVYGSPARPAFLGATSWADPNDVSNVAGVRQWLALCDYYDEDRFPHLVYFDSFSHALDLLRTVDLPAIASSMRSFNKKAFFEIRTAWADLFREIMPAAEAVHVRMPFSRSETSSTFNSVPKPLLYKYPINLAQGLARFNLGPPGASDDMPSDPTCQTKWSAYLSSPEYESVNAESVAVGATKCITRSEGLQAPTYLALADLKPDCYDVSYHATYDVLTAQCTGGNVSLTDPFGCTGPIQFIAADLRLECNRGHAWQFGGRIGAKMLSRWSPP